MTEYIKLELVISKEGLKMNEIFETNLIFVSKEIIIGMKHIKKRFLNKS